MLITISRQFAAGGSDVAERAANALGWRVVDTAFVGQVAERAGVPEEEVARLEERAPSFMERLARSTAMQFPELFLPVAGPVADFEEAKLVKITRGLVTELAAEGRLVLVGRAAAAVLAHESDTLHVRLVAPRPFRVNMARIALGLDAEEAERRLDETDRNRAQYHREFYERNWDEPTNYDLILNTERLGFDAAAELIVARARALGW